MVENRLHAWIDERCVEPRVQQVALPSLWPRKKNTRGPPSEEGDGQGVRASEPVRDIREEARREVEEERRRDREHWEREAAAGYPEGLRWRSKAEGVTFSYPQNQLITMPKKHAKKPDRPANLPDEPVESLNKQYYVALDRVWYVRKDEIGKEGSDFLSIRHFD
ncbi:MAG: hypothetical protein Q9198_005751 [Flavoplaca austrocitrina]